MALKYHVQITFILLKQHKNIRHITFSPSLNSGWFGIFLSLFKDGVIVDKRIFIHSAKMDIPRRWQNFENLTCKNFGKRKCRYFKFFLVLFKDFFALVNFFSNFNLIVKGGFLNEYYMHFVGFLFNEWGQKLALLTPILHFYFKTDENYGWMRVNNICMFSNFKQVSAQFDDT